MGKQVRVLHLIASNFYGGPEKQILQHLRLLESDKYSGLVCTFQENNNHNDLIAKAKSYNLDCCAIPMKSPLDIRALYHLYTEIKRRRIGLLCAHGYKSIVMANLVRKLLKVPTISFSRGYTAENTKIAFYEWLERCFVGKQDALIAVSQGQLDKLLALGVRPQKALVVHNAVSVQQANEVEIKSDPVQTRKTLGVAPDAKMVVSSGRLSPEKGHRYLIEAISLLPNPDDSVFVFCGSGVCLEPLKQQATRLGVLNSCRFVGFRKDILDIYYAMDLLVLPSLTEGLPNAVLEAFSFAKPVIAAAVGGVPELVEDGVNGILIKARDVKGLSSAIQKVLDEPDWAQNMGRKALEAVRSDFSFEQQNDKLVDIYDEVLGNV
jgi:glycosyltransferase involved in cell wall biosynthesis